MTSSKIESFLLKKKKNKTHAREILKMKYPGTSVFRANDKLTANSSYENENEQTNWLVGRNKFKFFLDKSSLDKTKIFNKTRLRYLGGKPKK